MKKICVCVLALLVMCPKVFASIPTYPTITPINLTISSFEYMDDDTKTKFTEAIRHFAVAIHEMTNGAHQLGRIKIVQRGELLNRELMHINWEENFRSGSFRRGIPTAEVGHVGSYIPFTQNARSSGRDIRIDHRFLRGHALEGMTYRGSIDTGYTLAHEAGHFIYGLFDEFTGNAWYTPFFQWFVYPNLPAFGDRIVGNSIMGTQRESAIGNNHAINPLATIFRANGLNFSTRYHYDLDNRRDYFWTVQRRMYPYTISGWDTLVSNVAPGGTLNPFNPSFNRSQFLDLINAHPSRHPNRNPAMPEMVITHTYGFPNPGADEDEFRRLSPVAMDNLQIEWGTTDRQRARLFLIGGVFDESIYLTPHLTQEELEELGRDTQQWGYVNDLAHQMNFLTSKTGSLSHTGLWALDNRGLHRDIVPLSIMTHIGGSHVNQAMTRVRGHSTNVPFHSLLSEAISYLQAYMDENGIILGDIFVLLGRMSRSSSDIPLSGNNTASDNSLSRKSRLHFIPITINGFNIDTRLMQEYRSIGRYTGGMSSRSIVPTNPENMRVINGTLWRSFMTDSYPLLNPWGGYMSYIATAMSGNFMGASLGRSSGIETQVIWQPFIEDYEELFSPRISPLDIRPVSITAPSFRVDSTLSHFLAKISVRNPYQHTVEVVLIDPSGTEHPVAMNWRNDGRSADTVVRINLDPYNPGWWRPVVRGVRYNEATIHYTIVGASRGLFECDGEWEEWIVNRPFERASISRPYKGAIFSNIDVRNVRGGAHDRANGGELLVTVTTYEGRYPLTNLNVTVTAQLPDGRTIGIPMNDGGIWPDATGRDGTFTGILRVGNLPEGQIILTASVSNPNGTATPTYFMNNTRRLEDFDLDGESPFFGEPITELFFRRVQKAFDIIGEVPSDAQPLPDFETVTLPLVNVGQISGLAHLLPGIEIELNVDIYPEEAAELLAEHLAWSLPLSSHPNLTISPDPQGRPNVVRVLFHGTRYGTSEWLQFDSATPRAMRGLMEDQTRMHRLVLAQPSFMGAGFNNRTMEITVLEGEEAFYNIWLSLPPGYDSSATWSMTANPDNAGEIVSQRADGVTFRTLRPGRFTMTLTSDIWPQLINRSVEVHSVFREQPGSQPGRPGDDAFGPNPIPGRPDPGGDDDVRTRPDTGNDGGNGGGPNRDPEYQDPQDPVLLPPELSRITLGGRDITDDGVRLIRQWETVPLVLEFRESIDRYMLSAAFMSGTNPPHDATSATSTIDNIALSEDGKTLSYEFMGKVPGQHRVFFNVERKDGIEAAGSFVLHVKPSPNLGSQSGPEEGEQGNEGSGGGCNAGAGALAAMLVLAAAAWKMQKS